MPQRKFPSLTLVTGQGFALNIGNSGYLTQPHLPAPFTESLPGSLYLLCPSSRPQRRWWEELITENFKALLPIAWIFLQGSVVDYLVLWDTTANCTLRFPVSCSARRQAGAQQRNFGTIHHPCTDTTTGSISPMPAAPLRRSPSDYWDICWAIRSFPAIPHTVHFAGSANASCPLMSWT